MIPSICRPTVCPENGAIVMNSDRWPSSSTLSQGVQWLKGALRAM